MIQFKEKEKFYLKRRGLWSRRVRKKVGYGPNLDYDPKSSPSSMVVEENLRKGGFYMEKNSLDIYLNYLKKENRKHLRKRIKS